MQHQLCSSTNCPYLCLIKVFHCNTARYQRQAKLVLSVSTLTDTLLLQKTHSSWSSAMVLRMCMLIAIKQVVQALPVECGHWGICPQTQHTDSQKMQMLSCHFHASLLQLWLMLPFWPQPCSTVIQCAIPFKTKCSVQPGKEVWQTRPLLWPCPHP